MRIFYLFLGAFIFRAILAFLVWHPDLDNHVDWGIRFWQYGPAQFYTQNVWSFTWPNQPPGTMYIFALMEKLYELIFGLFWWLNIHVAIFPSRVMFFLHDNLFQALLKLPSILGDLGIAYIIYRWLKETGYQKVATFGAALFLFNPVIWYNSAVWGQTDAIINFLTLLSLYLLLKKQVVPSIVLLALSFYIKASLLIFVPLFMVLFWQRRSQSKKIFIGVALTIVLIAALTYPFSQSEPFSWLIKIYQDKVFKEQLHLITSNAFNIWATIASIHARQNVLLLGSFSYELWGQILFGISYLPVLYFIHKKHDVTSILLAFSIVAFASFMLLTNMHERYLYPLFPVLTLLVAQKPSLLIPYLSISLISLLNLYNFWWTPRIELLINIMSAYNRVLPRVLGLLNFSLFLILYKQLFVKNFLKKQ